jgi:hypothetical protein
MTHFKAIVIVPIPKFHSLCLAKGERQKRPNVYSGSTPQGRTLDLSTHNILWPATLKNPSNCVFFACKPLTPAVLTL